MLIEGQFVLKAPIREVWDFLLKPETLGSCVPGCEKWEVIDERTFESVVGAQVGPMSARFKFTTTLTELDPPRHLKAVGEGADLNKSGSFRQETVVKLNEVSEEEVEVSYRTNITIVGKLATFGDRVMKAKAREVGDEFTQALNKRLLGEKAAVTKVKVSTMEMVVISLTAALETIVRFFWRLKDKLKGKES